MTDDKILKLLNSSNISDILIGLELIDDYPGFFRRHGINFYKSWFEIPVTKFIIDTDRFYYQITDGYYICCSHGYLSECEEPYDEKMKIIKSIRYAT